MDASSYERKLQTIIGDETTPSRAWARLAPMLEKCKAAGGKVPPAVSAWLEKYAALATPAQPEPKAEAMPEPRAKGKGKA